MSKLKISELSDVPPEGTGKQINFKHKYTEIDYVLALFQVNKGAELNPMYIGIAGVSFHVCGILVDFVMGMWTNRRGSTEPLLVSLLVFACGNLMYG